MVFFFSHVGPGNGFVWPVEQGNGFVKPVGPGNCFLAITQSMPLREETLREGMPA